LARPARRKLRPQLSYANVMATIAVFVALGGTGYAASKINGKNIKNGTIAGEKLKKNTLGGSQINEGKLRKLDEAAHADTADFATSAGSASTAARANTANTADSAATAAAASSVNGQSAQKFAKEIAWSTSGFQTMVDFGGVKLAGNCPSVAFGFPHIKAFNTSGVAGEVVGSVIALQGNGTRYFVGIPGNWNDAQAIDVVGEDFTGGTASGSATFSNGKETTFVVSFLGAPGLENSSACRIWGHLISG
jgi:hypothetical protein